MKAYTITALALIGVLLFAGFALAEAAANVTTPTDTETTEMSADPGITPDSAMYGLKTGWENLKLAFIFNQERKAQFELKLADLKLLELRKMAEKGNTKAMERIQTRHDILVEKTQARLAAIQEDTTEARAMIAAANVIGLEMNLKSHENRIEVLKDILAEKNLSEEARTAIESAVDKMENKTSAMEQKIEEKKDKIQTRLRAITEKNESEVRDKIEKLENSSGYTESLKKIAENRIAKTEAALEKVKAKVAEEEANGVNISAIETHIADAEAKLAEAKALYADGKYKEAIATLKPVSNYGRNISFVVKEISKARLADKKAEIKNLIEQAREKGFEIRERAKDKIQQRLNQTATGG
jgi:hypothetical protein